MIAPKKRFEVLKRDKFRCQYCGKTGKDVTLEVDHIIPKAKGGGDEMENLICACRECNMGKGSDDIKTTNKSLYKQKINDMMLKLKDYFYNERNRKYMGTIDADTYTLLCMYLTDIVKGQDGLNYCTRVGNKENDLIFKQGGKYCDEILKEMYDGFVIDYIDELISDVFDDNIRKPKNDDRCDKYKYRLNFKITEHLNDSLGDKNYAIRKYTLYTKLLTNG